MKYAFSILLPTLLLSFSMTASADPWKDESGHGKRRDHDRHEYREEFWDGNCKVKRKLEKNGEYKEERKCKPPKHVYHAPAPVYAPASPPPIMEPGVTIHGTVRLPY